MPRETVPVPASEVAERLLEQLAEGPATREQLAAKLGRAPKDATVWRRLQALLADGLVTAGEGGSWERCQNLKLPETLIQGDYDFPPDFDDTSRATFALKAHELVAADVAIDSFVVDLLENYVRCLHRARIANEQIDEDGLFQAGAKSGSRKFAHPGIAIAREAERDAHVYREAIEKRKRKDSGGGADEDDDLGGL